MAQKLKSTKEKMSQKQSLKDTQKKDTKLKGLRLVGNEKSGYVLTLNDDDFKDDIQITHEELHELYILLERKFGEFIGYKIN